MLFTWTTMHRFHLPLPRNTSPCSLMSKQAGLGLRLFMFIIARGRLGESTWGRTVYLRAKTQRPDSATLRA